MIIQKLTPGAADNTVSRSAFTATDRQQSAVVIGLLDLSDIGQRPETATCNQYVGCLMYAQLILIIASQPG